jgi:hypothetical protein
MRRICHSNSYIKHETVCLSYANNDIIINTTKEREEGFFLRVTTSVTVTAFLKSQFVAYKINWCPAHRNINTDRYHHHHVVCYCGI